MNKIVDFLPYCFKNDVGEVCVCYFGCSSQNQRIFSLLYLIKHLRLISAWQDYLRVQEANTTSVNLINASVDYVVRLQESMSDFYWHYSSSDEIDSRGREAFMVMSNCSNKNCRIHFEKFYPKQSRK